MIRQVTDLEKLVITGPDYYSQKIKAYSEAYGCDYNFCRFYSVDNGLATGHVMLNNSAAVIGGKLIESEELGEFIKMYAPSTIELPVYLTKRMKFEGYKRVNRILYGIKSDFFFDEEAFKEYLDDPVSLQQMFIILNTCFNGLEYDVWYADMSHRIRHGMSTAYTYKGSACVSLDFKTDKIAYLSSLATMPTERGKGYASGLLKYIACELVKERATGYVWAMESAMPFYKKLGFSPSDEDVYLVRDNVELFAN